MGDLAKDLTSDSNRFSKDLAREFATDLARKFERYLRRDLAIN